MKAHNFYIWSLIFILVLLSNPVIGQGIDKNSPKDQSTGASDEIRTITLGVSVSGCTVCLRKAELWYTEALKRLGYRFDYNIYPPQRGLIEANSGRVDREAYRVRFNENLHKQFSNLIRVKEPITESNYNAYSDFTTKDPGVGTGLGMSVSYFIVTEDHKGTLEVESQPGVGTKFIIRLPMGGKIEI